MSSQSIGNTSSNGWVVQKFGGTSVGKFPDKVGPPRTGKLSLRKLTEVIRMADRYGYCPVRTEVRDRQ